MRFTLFAILIFFSTAIHAVTAQHGMAVSAQHYATDVGIDILKKGGNAIDAAVAMGYALAVVDPCCGNIGGGGFMLIHFANGKNTFINFREKAPHAISTELFLDFQNKPIKNKLNHGYLAVGIPGTVLGLNTALENYGTLSLKQVIQPAINLAKNGFVLTDGDIAILKDYSNDFKNQSNIAKIFLKNDTLYQAGERLIQQELANTLVLIAQQGSQAFYNGKITNELVTASQKNGGVFSTQDFKNYTVLETRPITCTYRDYEIITTPLPGGGITICEILNISENYPLKNFGFHSVLATHYAIEAMRYAYADRNTYLGDPQFIQAPVRKLISKKYAKKISTKILSNKAGNSYMLGFIKQSKEKANTTSYVVVDKNGNAVSVTYTLNDNFGAKIIATNTGFFLNNEIDDFAITTNTPNTYGLIQGKANLLAPNKRPLSSMSPTIILKNKKLFMIIGTPGGSTIPTQLVETIQNVIDFDMKLQTAVDTPRFHMQWLPDVVFIEPDAFSKNTMAQLENMGYQFKLGGPFGTKQWGKVTAIMKNKNNLLEGIIDNRSLTGSASGY